MPEIVEVRRYADFLNYHLKNNRIVDIKILKGRYKTHKPFSGYYKLKNSLPCTVVDVKTKGKFIYFIVDKEEPIIIFNTLGLSGGWVYSKEENHYKHPMVHEFLNKNDVEEYRKVAMNHLNIKLELEKGSLYYFDMLSYGTIKVTDNIELEKKLNKLGPDFFDLSFTSDKFIERIRKRNKKKIGIVLMDQRMVSGIGNYLRADSLWLSQISPHRYVKDMEDIELEKLYHSIISLVWSDYDYKKAIKKKIIKKDFKTPQYYDRDFFIYYYEEDIYGNKVIKEELYEGSQKRSIYWVKKIQK